MIVGIGNDLIEIERVNKACEKKRFLEKCYTSDEIKLSEGKKAFLAGNFAVKEAVSKCFGTGFRGFGLIDIEVLRDELGCPYVNLYNGALRKAEEMGITRIWVTITNTQEFALAAAVAECEKIN